jgi:lysophospholipase L1-like esterase
VAAVVSQAVAVAAVAVAAGKVRPKRQPIQVLCYGDSNTWGATPSGLIPRFRKNVRWTGRLQSKLGIAYRIIEAGRGGRTTDLDDPEKKGRNGRAELSSYLQKYWPLDIIILMLGTNDVKKGFSRSAEDISRAADGLINDIQAFAKDNRKRSRIILVSPVSIGEDAIKRRYGKYISKSSVQTSKDLSAVYSALAQKHRIDYFDAATVAGVGKDAIHIDRAGHKALADALTKVVLSD